MFREYNQSEKFGEERIGITEDIKITHNDSE